MLPSARADDKLAGATKEAASRPKGSERDKALGALQAIGSLTLLPEASRISLGVGGWLRWLERQLDTLEVTGSSPVPPTNLPQGFDC